MNTHHASAELRSKCARAWLVELPEHRFTAQLKSELLSFIATLLEHETHLEAHKDTVPNIGDWRYRSQHMFAAQLSALCIGPQWKAMKDECDTVMGRKKICEEDTEPNGKEEGAEEEEKEVDDVTDSSSSSSDSSTSSSVMRDSDEEVESSAPETHAARTERKKAGSHRGR